MNITPPEPTACYWCGEKALYMSAHKTQRIGACREHRGRIPPTGACYAEYDDLDVRRARRIGKARNRAYRAGSWQNR